VDRAVRIPAARAERLKVLIPLVFFIIFLLLYMTFRSVSEAIIVMLSVVYAMTGGVILQWLLGYNFSVACGSATSRSTAWRCRLVW
jgi:Cu(I)/Ag(I) efflux system membrane protein CusA/SilA